VDESSPLAKLQRGVGREECCIERGAWIEEAEAVLEGQPNLVLILTCLFDAKSCYDNVFWGPSGPAVLHQMREWNSSSLGMYIDDGVILACAKTWARVTSLLRVHYSTCQEWLDWAGLAVELDKMEVLFFRKPGSRNVTPPPS